VSISFQIAIFIISVILGGWLVEVLKRSANIKLLLSFSGGFLLTIIFTHVLPESYQTLENTGYYILLGFFLQLVLEYFSKGAEHGHTHVHDNKISHFPIAILVSLSLHAFIESIPINHHLAHHHHHDNHMMNDLFWGVFIHKIPVAVALKTILDAYGVKRIHSWIYLSIFALMAPLGLLVGTWVSATFDASLNWLLAVAIGMFFHVATTIIFESSEGHRVNFIKLVAILLGFGVGLLLG